MTEKEVLSFDIKQIMEMVPHRYPFLLIDRITECVPKEYAKGYKNVTINEEFFNGHFPENPIMPGVLQVEALAQMGAGILMTLPEYRGKLCLFTGIDKLKFRNVVRPGDRIDMEIYLTKIKGPVIKVDAKSYVNGKLTVEGELTFAVTNK